MHEAIKERFVFRNLLLLAIGVAIIYGLHRLTIEESTKVIIDILVTILITCLAIFLELLVLPGRFRQKQLRTLMTGAGQVARESRTLDLILDQVVDQLRQDLDRVKGGFYTDRNESIPELSLRTIQSVTYSAFATFVVDERDRIYRNKKGQEYLQAWNIKAEELNRERSLWKKKREERGVHRLMIVDSFNTATDFVVGLIQDHISHFVDVSLIERNKAEHIAKAAECELDFGLFDETSLMVVKTRPGGLSQLSVYVQLSSADNSPKIAKYKKFRDKLLPESLSAAEFLARFHKPLNADFWNYRFQEHGPLLGPPHGLSSNDAMEMVSFVVRQRAKEQAPLKVAVLGLTPELLKVCINEDRFAAISVVDQSNIEIEMPYGAEKVSRSPSANWLTFDANGSLDAILGDECLNNLAIRQYRSFFRSMHASLKPGGVLVLRTLGRFGELEDPIFSAPQEQLLQYVKSAPGDETEVARAGRIIQFLHSKQIAFVEDDQAIETKRYNDLLRTWRASDALTAAEFLNYSFPDCSGPSLTLSSPTPNVIMDTSRDYFRQGMTMKVDAAYRSGTPSLAVFYRITPFIRLP